MNERVQSALDGDAAARARLTDTELATLRDTEALIAGVLRSVPVRPIPDLSKAVMDRLPPQAAKARAPRESALNWLWAPRSLSMQWRPAYAVAVAAMIAVFAAVRSTVPAGESAVTQQVLVEFRLDAPAAQQVELVGNFSDWKPAHVMKRGRAGTWTVVVPLTPGVHNYSFVVDGDRWVPDPMAPAVSDGFGGLNSQLAVLSPDQSRSL